MNIGLVGLGKMGLGFATRLMKVGYTVYGYDTNLSSCQDITSRGGIVVPVEELAQHAAQIIILVPAGKAVDTVIDMLEKNATHATTLIDAGNSHFSDSVTRYNTLQKKGIGFLDCGTSGGILGEHNGYSLTVGGNKKVFESCSKIFAALAQDNGYLYVGPAGSGHYVKMVHNGIEYGLLEAYAEGFNLLKNGDYQDLDLSSIAQTWNNGAIIASQLLALSPRALSTDDQQEISGAIAENGTARWTIENAEKHCVNVPVIQQALNVRLASHQGHVSFATRYIARMRNIFGGHNV